MNQQDQVRCKEYYENTISAHLPDTFKSLFRMERSSTEIFEDISVSLVGWLVFVGWLTYQSLLVISVKHC